MWPKREWVVGWSYIRWSSDKQSRRDSGRRQYAVRDGWLSRNKQVRLNTTCPLVDGAKSGFDGTNRLSSLGALKKFLEMVEEEKVLPGDFLIVENLDRLTREKPLTSVPMVLQLIKAGIRIVQLSPAEVIYDRDMSEMQLMFLVMELSRGHTESARKSDLVGKHYANRRVLAREKKQAFKGCLPSWLVNIKDTFQIVEAEAGVVRYIFDLALEGLEPLQISSRLTREGKTLRYVKRWSRLGVNRLLRSRRVIGEKQPKIGHKDQKPEGEPIAGYYPRIISDDVFYRVQVILDERKGKYGRPCGKTRNDNPFQGLLWKAIDGVKMHIRKNAKRRALCSGENCRINKPGVGDSILFDSFKAALLSQLREIQASELFNDPSAAKLNEVEGKLTEARKRLKIATDKFDEDPESLAWQDSVTKYDQEVRALLAERQTAIQESLSPRTVQWQEALASMEQDHPERLRQAFLGTIDGIWILWHRTGKTRAIAVQVWFKSGVQRSYFILHKGGRRNAYQSIPEKWSCISFAEAGLPDELDLRKKKDAKELASLLAKYPLP